MHPLAEFTPCSSDGVLTAFMRQLSSTHLLCALARLQQCGLHPVGSGDYCSIDSTIAGEWLRGSTQVASTHRQPCLPPAPPPGTCQHLPAPADTCGCCTTAGLLVLCRRASLGADEISPELLLTMLWSVACRPACLRWCLLQRRRFACRGQHPSS